MLDSFTTAVQVILFIAFASKYDSNIGCHQAYGEQFVDNLRPLCVPGDSDSSHTQALGHT
jgi:hypothetical protein